MLARWLQFLLGAWLVFAAFVVQPLDDAARVNDTLVGLAAAALAAVATRVRGLRRAHLALGLWLAVAPFALRYESRIATLNDAVVGALMFGLALVPTTPLGRPARTIP